MKCDWPLKVTGKLGQSFDVGCGRCPPCRQRKVDEWAFRLVQEEKRSINAYFVTLTYNEVHVPITDNKFMTLLKKEVTKHPKYWYDYSADPIVKVRKCKGKCPSFRVTYPRRRNPEYSSKYIKRDLPSFFKRLRKTQPDVQIKYYAVGEYGSQTKRPHYHMILYNIVAPMYPIGPDAKGNMKYLCPVIEKCWPFGTVDIGGLSSDSAAYCAKYVSKPRRIPEHKRDDRQKEFSIMSKGLGENYITDATLKYHQSDLSRNYLTLPGGYMKALPKYYRHRVYSEDQRDAQNRRIVREVKILDDKVRADFARKYGDDFDFDAYDLEVRKGRLRAYWKNLKKRE